MVKQGFRFMVLGAGMLNWMLRYSWKIDEINVDEIPMFFLCENEIFSVSERILSF